MRGADVNQRLKLHSLLAALAIAMSGTAVSHAQGVPRSFVASPDIYKVIAEDDKYRVIEVTWKPGQRDNLHSHGSVVAAYNLTDCTVRIYTQDGKSAEFSRKAGQALVSPPQTHSIENVGKKDCKLVHFEPK
jgi:mannose-6-phosphate isomerase-like protein (cupin superfamily)